MDAPADAAWPWNNPVDPAVLADALERLRLDADDVLLDVGCGRGEVLGRTLERWPCRAVAVDPDADALERARERLAFAGGRVVWHGSTLEEATLEPGAFAAALCLGASHAFGWGSSALPGALDGLARLLRPGGLLVLGEGYWKRPPAPDYLAATGVDAAELRALDVTLELLAAHGYGVLACVRSDDTSWDRFESHCWTRREREARERPDDEAATTRWERTRAWRDAYLRRGRDTMGFALWVLRAPGG